jgi:hypothetical protein
MRDEILRIRPHNGEVEMNAPTFLAGLLFGVMASASAATFNGCQVQGMTYWPPLEVRACGTVYVSANPGIVVYSPDAVITVPGVYTNDRIFANGFQGG